jgi:hypothetical protein
LRRAAIGCRLTVEAMRTAFLGGELETSSLLPSVVPWIAID